MKTPKVNIDRPHLSSKDIQGFKDFAALKQQLPVTSYPSLTSSWFGATFAGIAILAGIIGLQNVSPEHNETLPEQTMITDNRADETTHQNLSEASEGVIQYMEDIKPTIHEYKNADGYEFIHETGSKITIPANAFRNKEGALPEDIEFHYREFHDPISVWMSKIPMEYDSLERYFFESAGMNELRAYANGEELELDPENPIEISMVSFDDSDEMNLYALNDKTGDWTYLDHLPHENLMETIHEQNILPSHDIPDLKHIDKQIMALVNKGLTKPEIRSYNEQKHSFDLEVDLADYPSLSGFKNVIFEVVDQANFDTKVYDVEWSNAEILPSGKSGVYKLQLSKQYQTKNILVIPVLKGQDLQAALKTQEQEKKQIQSQIKKLQISKQDILDHYKKKTEQFEQENKARVVEDLEKLDQVEKRLRQQKAINYLSQQNFQTNTKAKSAKVEKAVVRTRNFFASMTGVFNFDCARRGPQNRRGGRAQDRAESDQEFLDNKFGKRKKVSLINKITGATIVPVTLFLIEKGRNLIYKFNKGEQASSFAFNPKAQNVVWCETSDGKIAVFRSEDFDRLPMQAENYELGMRVSPEPLLTKREIENFLGLNTFIASN